MRLVIVTGMSGAGKTAALKMLEDMGFYCVDNLPIPLVGKFAELVQSSSGEVSCAALGIDVRSGDELAQLEGTLNDWNNIQFPYEILFLDASDEVLIKRYKETRRSHPLAGKERLDLGGQGVKFFKQYVILKFKGIDNINDIEKYRKMPLLVSRENAVELEEDEYYIADIIGMDVYTEDGEKFGVLEDIMETGANDVYVVSTEEHTEVLLPAIHDCILDVDTENRKMTVHLMDGLI